MPGSKRAQWGWHCLTDHWANEIVRAANISSRDLVLDIGAGSGALTHPLAVTGARVIAIELHEKRAAVLHHRFRNTPNVKVVRADARDFWLPRHPFRVVANPPFSITTDLLARLTHPQSQLTQAHLVLQLQVARNVERGNWRRGRHKGFVATITQRLPRSAFIPRPKVDVAVVEIRRI